MRKRGQSEFMSGRAEYALQDQAVDQTDSPEVAGWFEMDPTPVFVLDSQWAVIALNRMARRLLETGKAASLRSRQLVFAHVDAQNCFTEALERVTGGAASQASLVLLCDDGRWRRLEVLRDGAAMSSRLVYVSVRGNPEHQVDVRPLLEAFGLSAAEGKILHYLAQGLAPKRIALRLGVSPNTVRAHLRSLYVKMHVHGMNELMRECTRLTA